MQLPRNSSWQSFLFGLSLLFVAGCATTPESSFQPTFKPAKDGYTESQPAKDVFQVTYEAEPSSVADATARAQLRACQLCRAAGFTFIREVENEHPYRIKTPELPVVGSTETAAAPGSSSHMDNPHQVVTFTVQGAMAYAVGYVPAADFEEAIYRKAFYLRPKQS
jgi:hypothetical protein